MTRKSKKKRLKAPAVKIEPEEDVKKVPIENLPPNYLWMRVNSGTKMRNVLTHAFEHFPKHGAIVWTAIGEGIGKGISCAQLFKKKYRDLHQVTRIRYVASNKSLSSDDATKQPRVPEMHILLTKDPTHKEEPGYQGPDDTGEFMENETGDSSELKTEGALSRIRAQGSSSGKITNLAAEEFAAMGLRTGQKRSRKEQHVDTPLKKNKRKGPGNKQ